MSQFDSLLDFGESTPSGTNGTAKKDDNIDEFDPFKTSPTIENKGQLDGNLLVDFTTDTEIPNGKKQNGTSEPFELSFEVSTVNTDEVATLSSDAVTTTAADLVFSENMSSKQHFDDEPASNTLFEFEASETTDVKSSNQGIDTEPTKDHLADFSNNCMSEPLYEVMDNRTETPVDADNCKVAEQQYESTDEFGNHSVSDEDLTQSHTPGEAMEEFQSRDVTEGKNVEEDQSYIEMSRPSASVDDFMNEYEVVSDTNIPEYVQPEKILEPVREPSPEPIREPSPEPMKEPVREPSPEPMKEPVREPSPEPIMEPVREPVREPIQELVREPSPIMREPSPELVMEIKPESIEEESSDSVRESSPEPASQEEGGPQDARIVSQTFEKKGYSDSYGSDTAGYESTIGSNQQHVHETQEKDEVHFTELSSVRNAFEAGGPQQPNVVQSEEVEWDTTDECVYENEPAQRNDIARETDRDIGAELPEIGMAKNLLSRFSQMGSDDKQYKREVTPPRCDTSKVEYTSEPSPHIQVFEGKAEAGIFESQPLFNSDVVRSGEAVHEPFPERGSTKNIASHFKQLESGSGAPIQSSPRRGITPDRAAGKVEFVSEPAAHIETYEGKADAGIFENQPQNYEDVVRSGQEIEEILPEKGAAKNMAQRFKQMEHETYTSPRRKREITPDMNTRGEYVSEPRAGIETYEGRAEAGIFENRPEDRPDVIKSDVIQEELLPQAGSAKNMAAKFKEMENNMKSPPPTPGRIKEFTPPLESGVVESHPQASTDVSELYHVADVVPERGTAKNMVSRFKQMEEDNSKIKTSNAKKEFTPPPRAETGIFENNPTEFTPDYNQKVESGISENVPEVLTDVVKETDPAKYAEELPERGTAKNLVSLWKQKESQTGGKNSSSGGNTKEFTPPRDEERVKSPGGKNSSVHPNDLPGQYQQQTEASVFESEPEQLQDVYREADTDWLEGMPKENAAKKMVAKFRHIQDEANKEPVKPISRKEDYDLQTPVYEVSQETATTPKKRGVFVIPTTPAEKCGACQKAVYAMEKFEMNKVIYHKNCFRCSHCKSKLTPKTFAANNGVIYCTNHLMQLFKSKGNYDEGFGREQHKKKWAGQGESTQNSDEHEQS